MTTPSIDRATGIERLAALESIDYEAVRVDEAKRLGIRSGILDARRSFCSRFSASSVVC
jgi:hypothetical protein